MADKLEERRDYQRGQWDAFDRVLALLNGMTTDEPITQDQMRRRVYGEVMSLKAADPEAADEITRLNAENEASIADVWRQADENHRRYSDTGDRESDIRFLTLGLTGEAGEVANFVKKRWRDGDGHDEDIKLEIADVCAYAFMLANVMGMTPADLIETMAHKQQVFIDKMKARTGCRHGDIDSNGYCHACRTKPFGDPRALAQPPVSHDQ